jgi:hypothetical protein
MQHDYDAIDDDVARIYDRADRDLLAAWESARAVGEVPDERLPLRWEICPTCRGEGHHARRLGVIDPSDWEWDELDDYRRGVYDEQCDRCHGTGKHRIVDTDALSAAGQDWVDQYWHDVECDARTFRAECLAGA